MAQVIWSEPALIDLEDIAGYISLDNPDAAQKLVQRVIRRTRHLEKHPESGRTLPDFPDNSYRVLGEPPCRIFYVIENSTVHILRVLRTEQLIRPSFFEDSEK